MMELKEGIYFRTKAGTINKIDSFTEDKTEFCFDTKPIFGNGEEYGSKWGYTKDIIKASNNIIDLIEVGDYVNGHPVTLICEDEVHPQNKCLRIYGRGYVWQKNIKSIVTKEQFSSMEYKVN